mmetsp:Transcript_138095/g.385268  ORF Transcript_138095/g.385268 Transcript_138095/m.385268 type:complete len:351 (+) Transcript_138095:470-1522(+)
MAPKRDVDKCDCSLRMCMSMRSRSTLPSSRTAPRIAATCSAVLSMAGAAVPGVPACAILIELIFSASVVMVHWSSLPQFQTWSTGWLTVAKEKFRMASMRSMPRYPWICSFSSAGFLKPLAAFTARATSLPKACTLGSLVSCIAATKCSFSVSSAWMASRFSATPRAYMCTWTLMFRKVNSTASSTFLPSTSAAANLRTSAAAAVWTYSSKKNLLKGHMPRSLQERWSTCVHAKTLSVNLSASMPSMPNFRGQTRPLLKSALLLLPSNSTSGSHATRRAAARTPLAPPREVVHPGPLERMHMSMRSSNARPSSQAACMTAVSIARGGPSKLEASCMPACPRSMSKVISHW